MSTEEKIKKSLLAFAISDKDVLEKLEVTDAGLSENEVKKRLEQYGPNRLTEKKKVSPLSLFINQFKNSLTLILLGSVVLVLFVYFFGEQDTSDLIEAGLILSIVIMIAVLGFIQEYKAEKALESLKKLLSFKAKVKRDNTEKEIDVADLVPGDIIILEEGLKVPADIRLLQVSALYTNEASLTGESTTVRKEIDVVSPSAQIADRTNMVFAGTVIASGRGVGVVVSTGDDTEIGTIAGLVSDTAPKVTPIQRKLDDIGRNIGYIVVGICVVVFIFVAFLADDYASLPFLEKMIHSFIAAIALAVAAIPEGLPAVVTISLALGTQRMAKKNALVRKLNAVETLGSTNVICSDKTGTLTKGEMTVRELFFGDALYTVTGTGYETKGEFQKDSASTDSAPLSSLLQAGVYCNNALLQDKDQILGDPTEAALLVSAKKAGIVSEKERVLEVPFSSERKMMSVVVKDGDAYHLYTKGAPEVVLGNSVTIATDKDAVQLEDAQKNKILKNVEGMNSRALRTLGFAYRKLTAEEFETLKDNEAELESKLTFLGLQGMIDPPRLEVKALIEQCNRSGIRTIMITGDHEITAKAVAEEIGITGDVMTGTVLEELDDAELTKIVEKVSVYARINPASKMKIVQALKKNGHIVAMTGDGVNDAPALKKADIGIAMGITGTDVAKEAADMVLLDDKFSTIVAAIEEGRGIFINIRKFVQYLLSCNIGEVMIVFVGVLIFKDLPLTAIMLLWINLVTDGLPAIALGLDPMEKDIMRFPPKKFQSAIITRKLWIEMFFFGVLLTVAILGLYALNLPEGHTEAKGAAFVAFAFFELLYLFIIRDSYNTPFFSNKWLFIAIFTTIAMQVAIVYIPFLADLFVVRHIDLFDWLYIGVVSLVMWVVFHTFKRYLSA